MYTQRLFSSAAVLIAMTAAVSPAQTITSAHSGLINYFDGAVSIDNTQIEYKVGKFSEIKENSVLSTGQGRAEILLTPGVYLRIGENTRVKMLDNRLLSTRVVRFQNHGAGNEFDPCAQQTVIEHFDPGVLTDAQVNTRCQQNFRSALARAQNAVLFDFRELTYFV